MKRYPRPIHARAHTRAQPSRIHHKTRMVSPPRCPNRHMATGGVPPTIHLTRATAHGPAHRRYHHPTARASTGRLTRRAPSPATPAPAGHPSGRQAAACRQSGQRTHTHARTRAGRRRTHASARVCAHLSRWCWIRRAARRRARGRDQPGAGARNKRESHAPSREATKHVRVIGCRGQYGFVEFQCVCTSAEPCCGDHIATYPCPTFATSGLLDSQVSKETHARPARRHPQTRR
jgi:hypothetical protein